MYNLLDIFKSILQVQRNEEYCKFQMHQEKYLNLYRLELKETNHKNLTFQRLSQKLSLLPFHKYKLNIEVIRIIKLIPFLFSFQVLYEQTYWIKLQIYYQYEYCLEQSNIYYYCFGYLLFINYQYFLLYSQVKLDNNVCTSPVQSQDALYQKLDQLKLRDTHLSNFIAFFLQHYQLDFMKK
ncbi:transmembrane protein, putative (macronuclear) [Tetrahymena thermophila SB210]|uniref:Transmembrane protein, putative n=1 Tax=Tetrahymena thermophila (strain SB210) TaxID=312017 RepID=A4VDH4_TETTS|nr:transmembrane protein, putative [Tetrahymena thermophila SB210]EDK31577.2 transmembrane protein, putative [Tetrahymena thermophila SB210]|eukprot:XP_001471417.2 transmembrane protein, putative [Tetrahymena thermophila SB210]